MFWKGESPKRKTEQTPYVAALAVANFSGSDRHREVICNRG